MSIPRRIWQCILAVYWIIGISTLSAQVKSADCWPSFRGDPQQTGNAPVSIQPPFKLLWTFKTGDAIKSSPVIWNGTIYIGSNDGFVYAVNSSGGLRWKFNTGNSVEAPPLIHDNMVYAGNLAGVMFALDAKTGVLKWKYTADGQISGSVNHAVSRDQKTTSILFGSYDFNLHCLDASTGAGLCR